MANARSHLVEWLVVDFVDEFLLVARRVRLPQAQHFVEDDTERPDIRLLGVSLLSPNLWRKVVWRSDWIVGVCIGLRILLLETLEQHRVVKVRHGGFEYHRIILLNIFHDHIVNGNLALCR